MSELSCFTDQYFMKQALIEAKKAMEEDEVPVGAVIVKDNQIIAKAHNQNRSLKDPTAHAELIAITQAANKLKQQFLPDCLLYVTLEPCIMCTGALVLARIKTVVYAADEPEFGAINSNIKLLQQLNSSIVVKKGVLAEESRTLLKTFFNRKRILKKMERWLSG